MKKVKREKSTTTRGHYVTNAQLLPAVLEAKQLGRVTEKLAKMLLLIAERYSRKSWFSGYSYREDMVALAMVNLCANALKFDPAKSSNPFAYYTTAIHNSFQQYKSVEKNQRNIRDSLLVDAGANPSFNYMEAEREHHDVHQDAAEKMVPEVVAVDGEAPAIAATAIPVRNHASGPTVVFKPGTFSMAEDGSIKYLDQDALRVKKGENSQLIVTAKRVKKVAAKKTAKTPAKKAAKKVVAKKVAKKVTKRAVKAK